MDWYEDNKMRRQLEETSKEEEKIARRNREGKGLQVEGAQNVPELLVSQILSKDKIKKEKKRSKVVGWKMEERACNQVFKDTQEMMQ